MNCQASLFNVIIFLSQFCRDFDAIERNDSRIDDRKERKKATD